MNLHAHLKLLVSEEQPYNYFFASYSLSSLKLFFKQSHGAKLLLFFGDFMMISVTMLQMAMLSFLFDRIVVVLSQWYSV